MTIAPEKLQRLQANRVRMTSLAVANTGLQAVVFSLFAWAGEVSWTTLGAFVILGVGIPAVFVLLIHIGVTERLKDPGMLLVQLVHAMLVQLGFLVAAPQLAVLFLVGVSVTYNFAMLSFSPRQFVTAWLGMGGCTGVAIFIARDGFRFPAVNNLTLFALWLYFFLCLRQLSGIGTQFSMLRRKLSERNKELSDSLARLAAVHTQERLMERERMSRELHDTLLQGFNGMVLRFHGVAQCIPPHMAARRLMDEALARADGILLQGRDKLAGMRVANSAGADLPDALCCAGEELSRDYGVEFAFEAQGERQALCAEAEGEAYRFARDAMLSAFQQAGTRAVNVELTYGTQDLEVRVRNDAVPSDSGCVLAIPAVRAYPFAVAAPTSRWHWLRSLFRH